MLKYGNSIPVSMDGIYASAIDHQNLDAGDLEIRLGGEFEHLEPRAIFLGRTICQYTCALFARPVIADLNRERMLHL